MKRRVHLLLMVLLIVLSSCRSTAYETIVLHNDDKTFISIEEAQTNLLTFMSQLQPKTKGWIDKKIDQRYAIGGNGNSKANIIESPLVYVFNFADNQGYALVSGDSRTPAVLCLTEKGHYTPNDENGNIGRTMVLANIDTYCRMQQRLPIVNADGNVLYYEDYVNNMFEENHNQRDGAVYDLNYYGTIIGCEWGGIPPFNANCYDSLGINVSPGCTAIAVGQIMYYWHQNTTYDGNYYDWDKMEAVTHYYSSPTDTSAWPSVQRLLRALGNSENLDIDYDDDSVAYTANASRTFENFGYSTGGALVLFSSRFLESMIQNGPMLMRGESNKRVFYNPETNVVDTIEFYGGHAWVADQVVIAARVLTPDEIQNGTIYPLQKYLHLNWGWSGIDNGYYLCPNFDSNHPGSLPPTRSNYEDDYYVDYGEDYNYQYNIMVNSQIHP